MNALYLRPCLRVLLVAATVFADQAIANIIKEVVRGEGQYPPQEFFQDEILQGLHVDMVNAVGKDLGWELKWRSLPWKRAIKEIEMGTADMITFISRTEERAFFAWFPEDLGFADCELSKSEMAFFTLRKHEDKNHFDGNLKEFAKKNFTIGASYGFDYGREFQESKFKVENLSNETAILEMLLAERIDLGIGEKKTVTYLLNQKGLSPVVQVLKPSLSKLSQNAAFSKKNNAKIDKKKAAQEDAKKFAEAIIKFKKSDQYQVLLRKYGIPAE